MSLDVFGAYVDGYRDRLVDRQIIALQTGHWAAYFVGSKHPKPVKELAESIIRTRDATSAKAGITRPEVDVESYLEMEASFNARRNQQGR